MSDGFLSRWARRKQAVRVADRTERPAEADAAGTEITLDPARPPGAVALPSQPVAPSEGPADAVPDDWLAKLPSLDSLTPETDLTAFLQSGVPTALRNAALRRMWSVDPAIRDFVSEAREYAYDWNTPGGVPGMGPLLPTDDVKAMLRRVIDGVPTAADDGAEAASPDLPEPPPALPPVGPEAITAAVPPQTESASNAENPPPAVETHASVAGAEQNPPEVAPAPLPRPRLRRHGGAMPT